MNIQKEGKRTAKF